ncbi:MAG: hypothetical protein ACLQQ4_08080 [Bacteroidia bacterium]
MDTHNKISLWRELERELYMFYSRENHTIGNYLFLYTMIALGILAALLFAELIF